ncbi:DNA repair protein RecO [Acuticoccus sp. MNP-M23]|uniref:DNA repair protein RecO n=1 Tax=Acuticoccus sp. MNP-M23 TaxID=3072793 RepID=UPI0028160B06|nr:DNA repair protein RecO [Acuticoccus sp. MNP-M23]WMS43391.1 DNA repair protein RecO [Acuticoccus sp. MNP-M23]
MEWRDEALILSARPFGETSKIVEVLTPREGRTAGMVRGARGKTMRALLQPGNRVDALWRGRLDDQLGTFQLELLEARAGLVMESAWGAFGLQSLASLLAFLPERDPHPRLFAAADALVAAFALAEAAGESGVRFEIILLEEFGFGLDLTECAVTGTREDLTHVSPRTGRAVCRAAAAPYVDRLLPLPAFLAGDGPADAESVAGGFRLTGHFLATQIAGLANKRIPPQRERFVSAVVKAIAKLDAARL